MPFRKIRVLKGISFTPGLSTKISIDPIFEKGDDFSTEHNGERPFGHEINEENNDGFFAVLLISFLQGLLDVHSQYASKVNDKSNRVTPKMFA
jgi:hypothetical protein